MKQFLTSVWKFYSTHTILRHGLTALVAVVIVEAAPWLTNWATDFFSTNTVEATAVALIGAATRWGQIQLEAVVRSYLSAPTEV